MSDPDTADLDKHSDEELHEGAQKADEQSRRVADEDSDAALDANRQQREAIADELERRDADDAGSEAR